MEALGVKKDSKQKSLRIVSVNAIEKAKKMKATVEEEELSVGDSSDVRTTGENGDMPDAMSLNDHSEHGEDRDLDLKDGAKV